MNYLMKPPLGTLPNYGHELCPTSGLWLMNEGSGNKVFDLSGNGNTGTFVGDTHWVVGKYGHAVDFDGTQDWINLGMGVGDYENVTVSIVIKFDSLITGDRIFVSGSANTYDWGLIVSNSKVLMLNAFASQTWPSTSVLSTGVWYHIVGIRNSTIGSMKVYLNGVLQTDTETYGPAGHTYASIASRSDDNFAADCQVSHGMIFDKAKSASEIALLYREPFIMFERDPIELWVGSVGAGAPVGNAGIMTPNTGFWGPTF